MYKVIEYLRKKGILEKYVVMSATSNYLSSDNPYNLLDWETNSRYHSLKLSGQSVSIEFAISPIYVEKLMMFAANCRDPYHWVLEGSQNRRDFTVLVTNNGVPLCTWTRFDGNTFRCSKMENKTYNVSPTGFYKTLRIRSTGTDSNNEKYLVFTGIEFIGKIQTKLCSLNYQRKFIKKLLLFVFLF